jgi:hypothetical protein
MSIYNQGPPGLGHVGSYQVSGKPFVSGGIDVSLYTNGPLEITFPSVTRWIIVRNSSRGVSNNSKRVFVAASANGITTGEFFIVNDNYTDATYNRQSRTPRLELKLTKLYLSGAADNVDVIAGLTGIPTSTITNNWSGSEGVG